MLEAQFNRGAMEVLPGCPVLHFPCEISLLGANSLEGPILLNQQQATTVK